jgi:hypothetical protein
VRIVPLRGSQIAYYLKKRNPKLYRRAREIKDRCNVTWDEAFAIVKGKKKPPTQAFATGAGNEVAINDVVKRVEVLERRVNDFGKIVNPIDTGLWTRLKFSEYNCIYMDSKGYCKYFYWEAPLKGLDMVESAGGKKRYYLNVKKCTWFCPHAQDTHQNT